AYKKPVVNSSFSEIRSGRKENIILIADDDLYMRTLVKKGITGNFTVHEVGDGAEVLTKYIETVPDILLLDIHLPNIDGKELLNKILTCDPQAFVVMLSADSSPENVKMTLTRGAKGFLAKPFTKERLQDSMKGCATVK